LLLGLFVFELRPLTKKWSYLEHLCEKLWLENSRVLSLLISRWRQHLKRWLYISSLNNLQFLHRRLSLNPFTHVYPVLHVLPSLVETSFEVSSLPLCLVIVSFYGGYGGFCLFDFGLFFLDLSAERIDLSLKGLPTVILLFVETIWHKLLLSGFGTAA